MHSIAEIKQVNNQLDVLVVTATPEAISAHINEKIRNEMPLQQARPQFLIEGDHVIIEGEVENVTIKRNFGYLVSEVPGVRFVTNNLTVKINEKEIADFRELLKKSTIYFDANADSVSSDQFKLLDAILEYSRRFNVGKLVIKGYSDNSSNPDYNLDLSRQRADVIAAYFNSNHYPPGRIIIEYYGENFPVASNVTADGRAANRRVEFEFMEAR